MQDDWEAIEEERNYWAFGQGYIGTLAERLIDEVDRMGVEGPSIEDWMKGIANGQG